MKKVLLTLLLLFCALEATDFVKKPSKEEYVRLYSEFKQALKSHTQKKETETGFIYVIPTPRAQAVYRIYQDFCQKGLSGACALAADAVSNIGFKEHIDRDLDLAFEFTKMTYDLSLSHRPATKEGYRVRLEAFEEILSLDDDKAQIKEFFANKRQEFTDACFKFEIYTIAAIQIYDIKDTSARCDDGICYFSDTQDEEKILRGGYTKWELALEEELQAQKDTNAF